jgi:outer membrane protein
MVVRKSAARGGAGRGSASRGLASRGLAWTAGIAAFVTLAPGAEGARAQTLAEAVRMALETNPGVAAQRAQVAALGERAVQAVAQRRATLGAEVSASANSTWSRAVGAGGLTDPQRTDTSPATVSLSASQPIWLAGRVQAASGLARAQIEQADARLRAAEFGITRDVLQGYADLRRDLEGVSIRNQNVQALTRQLEATRARFEVGELTRTDVAQVEARLAASRANLALAQARLEAARAAVTRLIGQLPADQRPTLIDVPLPATLQQAETMVLAENPELAAARAGEAIARASASVIETEFRPRASIVASATGALDQGFDGNRGGATSVGARLTVPFYNGGVGRSRIREALGNAGAAALSASDVERQLIERTGNAWRGVASATAALAATTEQVAAARIAFEGAELEQSVGLRTTLDVLIQQQELLEAELSRAAAERDLYVARAGLAAVSTTLRPEVFEAARPPVGTRPAPAPLPPEWPLVIVSRALDAIPLPSVTPRGPTGVRGD